MTRLRLVFMGTPEYAVPSLEALLAAGFDLACVYTQPPRRRGRGQRAEPSPVQRRAEQAGLAVRAPLSLKDAEAQNAFAALEADAGVAVAYGLILPPPILRAPRLGCINAHASLLPRWRGAAPIQRALMAGDPETGVTIMQMDEGLDTGPLLLQERVPIGDQTTAAALHDRLAALSGRLLVEALNGLAQGRLAARAQPDQGATYAKKIDKSEGLLDWRLAAPELARRVRALSPYPGAHFEHGGARIKVLAAESRPSLAGAAEAPPGTVADARLAIVCGDGTCLYPLRLQRAGKAPVTVEQFLRGYPIPAGSRLSCPATS